VATPQRPVRDVGQVIPEDGIIALDNGMYSILFAPNTVLLENALTMMGAGLRSAMMAAMLNR
jgi:acetolactate synthase I/II/III large subunit